MCALLCCDVRTQHWGQWVIKLFKPLCTSRVSTAAITKRNRRNLHEFARGLLSVRCAYKCPHLVVSFSECALFYFRPCSHIMVRSAVINWYSGGISVIVISYCTTVLSALCAVPRPSHTATCGVSGDVPLAFQFAALNLGPRSRRAAPSPPHCVKSHWQSRANTRYTHTGYSRTLAIIFAPIQLL